MHNPTIMLKPFDVKDILVKCIKNTDSVESILNPVMLVFIGKLSLSTYLPGFQLFFWLFLHHFVLTTLATTSTRVKSFLHI